MPNRHTRANTMAAYPTHATRTPNRNYPPSRAGNVLMAMTPARGHSVTCQWCCKPLTGKAEKWCSPVCRSSASRRKHSEAIKALAAAVHKKSGVMMSKAKATETVTDRGLPAVEDRLNALGWYWYPRLRGWFDDTDVQWGNRVA
jgi:hypothetical protein